MSRMIGYHILFSLLSGLVVAVMWWVYWHWVVGTMSFIDRMFGMSTIDSNVGISYFRHTTLIQALLVSIPLMLIVSGYALLKNKTNQD